MNKVSLANHMEFYCEPDQGYYTNVIKFMHKVALSFPFLITYNNVDVNVNNIDSYTITALSL